MYKCFNLELKKVDSQKFLDVDDVKDISTYNQKIEQLRENLNRDIERVELPKNSDDSIDASQLINNWFPLYKPDVFISHSHTDELTAKRIACWLEKNFNLNTFIDSTVWGNSDELLKKIDDLYCISNKNKNGNTTYNYDKRNFTTSHVHMMLSTALNDMIHASECVIFLNTPSSVQTAEVIKQKTNSPWIYSELKTACIVEKIKPRRQDTGILHHKSRSTDNTINENISYSITKPLESFESLDSDKLKLWLKRFNASSNVHALDCLYDLE